MKWIGQHIWDFVSRFRNDVYLENIADGTVDSDKFLGLDSDNKIVKEAVSMGAASTVTVTDNSDNAQYPIVFHNDSNSLLDDTDYFQYNPAKSTIYVDSGETECSVIALKNFHNGTTAPKIQFYGQRANDTSTVSQDGDDVGSLTFYGKNDAGGGSGTVEQVAFAKILAEIQDASDSDEAGKLSLLVACSDGNNVSNTPYQQALIATGHGTNNTVDVGVGYGATSTTTVAGSLNVTSGADINNPADGGTSALIVDNDDVDQIALDIDAANTTADIIDIDAQALTTGSVINIDSNSLVDGGKLINADWDLVGAVDDGFQYGIRLNIDKSGNVASGENNYIYGSYIGFDDNGTNVGNSYFYGSTVNITDANDSGTNRRYGYQAYISGGDANKSYGYYSNVINGGYDFYARSSASQFDYATWQTGANGATTLTTEDNGGAAAHFEIAADGDITLDSAAQIKLEPASGSNILLDGTIAIDAGVVTGATSITSTTFIGNRTFTITSDTHFECQGDVLYFGGGSTTQGDLCYLKENGEWGQADADGAATGDDADRDAMGMLAIALGADPDVDGMFIKGVITLAYDMGDVGNPLYVKTTAGQITSSPSTASGDFIRVVGYCLDDTNGQIYFNPDNTWVEIA